MNDTELLLNEIMKTLKDLEYIQKSSIRHLAKYFEISHQNLYNFIKDDRISIKFFKAIKKDKHLKHIYISDIYIIDRILMGL